MKYLVIAEKPSVSKSIAKVIGAYRQEDGYLEGGDCVVSWCLGHLAEYAAPEHYDERYENWRFEDLPILPAEWKLLVHSTKKPQFNVLRKLLRSKKFDYVVNACDAGREGEAIFRRVYALAGSKLPIKRLWISSMEDAAIQQGFENLKDGAAYDNLFAASECRAKADWLIGMNGTRAFTKKYGRKQTIGRVQTPTLAMLAERQTKIQNFVKEPYYKVELFGAGVVAVSEQMAQEQDADTMQAACDGQCAVVGSIERKRVEKKPPKLYDLTTLQREANRYYGMTASQTLQALQELYEEKLVTYPRTDSQFVTEDMRKTVESLVLALDGAAADVSCVINNSKVTDHHAILPTMQGAKCNKAKLSETKQKILSLIIWKQVQAVQPSFIYEDVLVTVCCQGRNFTAKYKDVLQPGYVDDGYTGTNFNRPAFQKMIVDLKQGDIKVIMVKDLSRLGRDYIGVGDYIEQIFPLMGVRFIAVNNSFDSMKLNNGTPGIEVAVSNLVNNMYSRDIAKKIRAALETNWKNGKATCTNVPFGYVWNKKGGRRWEIDPEAAPCVKKVFELALSGRNTTQIAYGMNELQFPTPGLYAKRKNLLMGSNPIIAPDSEMLWNAAIVWRILRRYEYTGALVMGRRKKIDVNTTSIRTLPEDKWIIAENAHEAIVTKDEYYQAQKAIRNVTPIQYKVGDDFALKGKICCGNCNRQLRHERQYGEMVFYCGYKRSAGKFSKCYGGYYREYSVNAKVARAIKTVFYALDVVNQGMQEKQSITVRCVDIEDLEKQAEAIRVEQIKLYESYADGVLRRDAYIEKKKALSEKLAALQDSIRTEKEEQECADELDEEIRALTKQASEKTYIGGLTKECVDAFVSMVYLYDDQTMKIEFNCEDVIRRAMEKYGT